MFLSLETLIELTGLLQKVLQTKMASSKRVQKSWYALILYQVLFSSVLTLYFGLCMYGYLATVDPFIPRLKLNQIEAPGLMFRPLPEDPYSTLIHFKHGGSGNWQKLKAGFRDFLKPYGFGKFFGPSEMCLWTTNVTERTRCHVNMRLWIDRTSDVHCSAPEAFGYIKGFPCIVVKINRVYGWEPEPFYNLTEVDNHPTLPVPIKDAIHQRWQKFCENKSREIQEKCPQLRMVWLNCEGVTEADKEYMGAVRYTPYPGFPGFFYPFLNQEHFISPLVWIQFHNLTPGVLVSIQCKIWARNIRHDSRNPRRGGVRFEMLMD